VDGEPLASGYNICSLPGTSMRRLKFIRLRSPATRITPGTPGVICFALGLMRSRHALAAGFAVALSCAQQCAAAPMTWPCQGRCIDAAMISNRGYAFFFRGGQFWRYDVRSRRVEQGEQPLRLWPGLRRQTGPAPERASPPLPGFPQSWSSGIDGALNTGDGKAYWFKGSEYVRLDITSGKVDAGPLPISSQWPGLPQTWSAGFDAAVYWSNRKVYFFKGREYLVYDLATNTIVGPQPIAGNLRGLPEAWAEGIDTAVNWANGKVYIFKGADYVRYDVATNKADRGYPSPIANWHGLMALVDWPNWLSTNVSESGITVGREPNNKAVFLCAVKVGNAIYPGKTWAESKSCVYSDGQRESRAEVYAVATTKIPIAWGGKSSAPTNRWVPVGNSRDGQRYYLCRAHFAGGLYPGRIEGPSGGCTISAAGRSHTLDGAIVEVAAATTTANAPYIQDLVRMLSPLPRSELFKDVCAAEVVLKVDDASAAAQYPRELPEFKTLVQLISRNSCAMLYKKPNDVPRYARKCEILVKDYKDPGANPYRGADVLVYREDSYCQIKLRGEAFRYYNPPNYFVLLMYHEVTHTTQQSDYGPDRGAINEGVATYIEEKMWERRHDPPSGDWRRGYSTMAYFLMWLEQRYPDFVYKLLMSAATKERIGTQVFRRITGKPIEQLWQEYQASIPATLAEPESLLR
jgi:hypothetical protein